MAKTAVKPAPKARTLDASAADIAERFKDFPAIDVVSRRFLDPNDPGSLPILLKGESPHCCLNSDHQRMLRAAAKTCHQCGKPARLWHIHTCNTAIEGRWAQMKSKGYVPVLIEDLLDTEDVSDLFRQKEDDGKMYVRRGDRGKEITMKQPLEIYNYLKRLQAEKRKGQARSKKFQREELAEVVGAQLGDEAGSAVYSGAISVEMMKHDKTTLEEEAGD